MKRHIDDDLIKWPLCVFDCEQWPSTQISESYTFNKSSSSTLQQVGGKWGDHYQPGMPNKNEHQPYFTMAAKLGLEDYLLQLQTQHPGQQMAMHFDAGSRKRYQYLSDSDHKSKLRRVFIFLDDWHQGQVIQMDQHTITHWSKGQVLAFDWTTVKHGTANFGKHDRPMLVATGIQTQKWNSLWDNNNAILQKIGDQPV